MAYLTYYKFHPTFPLSFIPLHFLNFIIKLSLLLLCFVPHPCSVVDALSFNFQNFSVNQTHIIRSWDAEFFGSTLSLTRKFASLQSQRYSAGKALYHKTLQLWEVNGNTRKIADFTTRFSFKITSSYKVPGQGLAFALIPENVNWAPLAKGDLLGLFQTLDAAVNGTGDPVVAVEFDTHGKEDNSTEWNEPQDQHIGIDVNSIISKATLSVPGGFVDRGIANVWVAYDSKTKILNASLIFSEQSSISYYISHVVDLSVVLPQRVRVGFTAATAKLVEFHEVYSWSFYSSLEETFPLTPPSEPSLEPLEGTRTKVGLVVGVTLGLFVVSLIISGAALWWFQSRRNNIDIEAHSGENPLLPLLVEDLGPKRLSYVQLHEATNGFAKEMILGKGGFGDVFEGTLGGDSNNKVAVKKFRSGSNQGEAEYVSEINVISRLKHKNLVQLKGWCHENDELLLVYEFLPNRSLDIHLFGKTSPLLTWPKRYNIALGVASGLHYLQEGSDPGVVHRDIKSSNIMLDSNFNAKLGDFGLAKLTNHEQSLTLSGLAGTLGYFAPEVIMKGKASKTTDTYSYGVVALELASGRKPINQSERDASKAELVSEWVWDLYKKGLILEATDKRLNGEYDKDQARQMLLVGLWCCHPDATHRPSMSQVIDALNFDAQPKVPLEMPAITYISPLMNLSFPSSNASAYTEDGSTTREAQTTTTTTTTTRST